MNWSFLFAMLLPLALVALALAAVPLLRRNPRGTLLFGLAWVFAKVYARLCHRLRVEGGEHLGQLDPSKGLIVIANHTAGLDPLLLQLAMPFEIRWMMAKDMAHPRLDFFWSWLGVIRVNRAGSDSRSLLAAVRHVKRGGVLGLFPEGFVERPPRQLHPFRPGLGLIVTKCGCPVLPVVIEGTPQVDPVWASLFRFSRSRLRILPPIKAEDLPQDDAAAVTQMLQDRFAEATGWEIGPKRPVRPAKPTGFIRSVIGKRVEES